MNIPGVEELFAAWVAALAVFHAINRNQGEVTMTQHQEETVSYEEGKTPWPLAQGAREVLAAVLAAGGNRTPDQGACGRSKCLCASGESVHRWGWFYTTPGGSSAYVSDTPYVLTRFVLRDDVLAALQ